MIKNKTKKILDYLPLIILTVSAFILLWTIATTDSGFHWKHIVGLILLPVNYFLFYRKHQIGVLAVGATLFLGLFGLLSYSSSITIITNYIGSEENKIPFFYGQPIFLLWLLIHFIVSGRYYVGIVTKKYWQNFYTGNPAVVPDDASAPEKN